MNLTSPIYQDADKARAHLEAIRWPDGPICPHCGSVTKDHYRLEGKTTRPGLYKCKDCLEPFTVTVRTVFERSKIPLNKWVLCAHLMAASKKGYSSHQMHRTLGVTYKTAWFMTHRLREAMKPNGGGLLGRFSGTIEADETFIGHKPGTKIRRGHGHKNAVFSLVERGGQVRSFHVNDVTGGTLKWKLAENVSYTATLMTDEARQYTEIGKDFSDHQTVNHSAEEYVRGDAHTNTIEGYFSIFKRGMYGVYQHCSSHHLHRYTTEFDFRYNHRQKLGFDDAMRAEELLKSIGGKRLTYY